MQVVWQGLLSLFVPMALVWAALSVTLVKAAGLVALLPAMVEHLARLWLAGQELRRVLDLRKVLLVAVVAEDLLCLEEHR